MNDDKLTLVKGKQRFKIENCPCGKNNKDGKFVPFVGHEVFGYCHSCDKTIFPPTEKDEFNPNRDWVQRSKPTVKQTTFIPFDEVKESLSNNEPNYFLDILNDTFGQATAENLKKKYRIGTSNHWTGASVFWQIDILGKVRTGKIILYDRSTKKRVKDPFNHVYWKHSTIQDFNLNQCLFGEHLLSGNSSPIAIVESEKTAIICSYFHPNLIWLATGGKTQFKAEKMSVLKGRKVFLFPDLNAFDEWTAKAEEFSKIATLKVSDLLERKATNKQRNEGLDLADYLLHNFQAKQQENQRSINDIINLIPKGKMFYPYELFERYQLTENEVREHLEECMLGTYWRPFDNFNNIRP